MAKSRSTEEEVQELIQACKNSQKALKAECFNEMLELYKNSEDKIVLIDRLQVEHLGNRPFIDWMSHYATLAMMGRRLKEVDDYGMTFAAYFSGVKTNSNSPSNLDVVDNLVFKNEKILAALVEYFRLNYALNLLKEPRALPASTRLNHYRNYENSWRTVESDMQGLGLRERVAFTINYLKKVSIPMKDQPKAVASDEKIPEIKKVHQWVADGLLSEIKNLQQRYINNKDEEIRKIVDGRLLALNAEYKKHLGLARGPEQNMYTSMDQYEKDFNALKMKMLSTGFFTKGKAPSFFVSTSGQEFLDNMLKKLKDAQPKPKNAPAPKTSKKGSK